MAEAAIAAVVAVRKAVAGTAAPTATAEAIPGAAAIGMAMDKAGGKARAKRSA